MAGVKVTDLTTLGTADATDILYIVDTTANQSKQIQVQNIYDGLPQFESGTFTPTVSGVVNSISVTVLKGIYSRVGDVVTVSVLVDATFDTLQNQGGFELSLPIASNFTDANDCIGTPTYGLDLTELVYFNIVANTANNTIEIGLQGVNNNANLAKLIIQYQYVILP